MQVQIETTRGLEKKMRVAMPGDEVDREVDARLRQTAKTADLRGFRKGKVPFRIVKNRFGKGVRDSVVNDLIAQGYSRAINQQSLRPVGPPRIQTAGAKEGEDLEFTAVFEVFPEVRLPDFAKLNIERLDAEIAEADVEEMIQTLRRQRQTWEPVDRAAATGDRINIDYRRVQDGEDAEATMVRGQNIVLGQVRLIPGFEAGIEGRKAGESFTLLLDAAQPDEAAGEGEPGRSREKEAGENNRERAGQQEQDTGKMAFEITLNSISEAVLPPFNEEFFSSFGIENGGEAAFREEVISNMRREMHIANRRKLRDQVMDGLLELADIDVPATLIAAETAQLRQQAMQRLTGGATGPAAAPLPELPDELFQDAARKRVLISLVFNEIVEREKLRADPVKVRKSLEDLASTYEQPAQVIDWYYRNKEELAAIESTVVEDQVLDYVIERARVEDRQVSYREIVEPVKQPGMQQPAATGSGRETA